MDIGDGQGLEAVYRGLRAELLRFLIVRSGDAGEAEDLMQELWIKIQQMPSGPIAHGRAYLFRMAQNLMIDRLRERQRRERRERAWQSDIIASSTPGSEPKDPERNAEDAMLDREERAVLASALANLPPGARRAFELHKLRGLSHSQVAAELGISRSGVEKHMSVAMKFLRRALLD
ncbi:RNA polymerase sigma factor [Sphingomonas sp. GB1N7]|uniref:RNA polymerase sigma factor n=1 Tax=Parasphingomonas caseinilytica TaxID=3096158 RepID=UPI002FC99A18